MNKLVLFASFSIISACSGTVTSGGSSGTTNLAGTWESECQGNEVDGISTTPSSLHVSASYSGDSLIVTEQRYSDNNCQSETLKRVYTFKVVSALDSENLSVNLLERKFQYKDAPSLSGGCSDLNFSGYAAVVIPSTCKLGFEYLTTPPLTTDSLTLEAKLTSSSQLRIGALIASNSLFFSKLAGDDSTDLKSYFKEKDVEIISYVAPLDMSKK